MELILLSNGEQIERTHFLKDLKVGNRLFSYKKNSKYNNSDPVVEYEVVKIGRKYAEIAKISNVGDRLSDYYRYKMLLSNGSVYKDKHNVDFDLFASRDELLASIQNNRLFNELKIKFSDSILNKSIWDKLQPKHIKRLNDLVEEILSEEE